MKLLKNPAYINNNSKLYYLVHTVYYAIKLLIFKERRNCMKPDFKPEGKLSLPFKIPKTKKISPLLIREIFYAQSKSVSRILYLCSYLSWLPVASQLMHPTKFGFALK